MNVLVRRLSIVVACCVVCALPSRAELRLRQYKELVNEPEFQTYIYGVGMGLSWANADLRDKKQQPLYCAPATTRVTRERYLKILAGQIERDEKAGIADPEAPLEALLLFGLEEEFPCK